MGLSSEERQTKLFASLAGMRRQLLILRSHFEQDGRLPPPGAAIVDSWVSKVDLLSGLLVEALSTSSVYWLLGSNNRSVFSLYSEDYDLGHADSDHEWDRGTIAHFYFTYDQTSLATLARFWTSKHNGFEDDRDVRVLAAFWEAFFFVDAVLYPLNRYDDGCFPRELRTEFLRLSGEMLARRFALVSWAPETDARDHDRLAQLEQVLLCRYRLVQIEKDRVFDEANAKGQGNILKPFDQTELLTRVGKLSIPDLQKALQDARDAKYDRAPAKDKPLAKMVPEAPTAADLNKIIDESADFDAVEKATRELAVFHSTYRLLPSRASIEARKKPLKAKTRKDKRKS